MNYFIGLDVQTARGCPFAILDDDGDVVDDGWVEQTQHDDMVASVRNLLTPYAIKHSLALAIDAPRVPLPAPRRWYWRGGRWRQCQPKDQGAGRHCEVVIAAHRLANPQWTPARPPFPRWMELGFALFDQLGSAFAVYEVFPSASYRIFEGDTSFTIRVRVGNFRPGPKDMLDAYVAAATLREFVEGRGCEVGGGDGLGSIILPRPIREPIEEVLKWPGTSVELQFRQAGA